MSVARSTLLVLSFLMLTACGPGFGAKIPDGTDERLQVGTYRISPAIEQRRGQLRTIAVMPAKIDVIQLTAGGQKERIDEWSAKAEENAIATVQAALAKNKDLHLQRASTESLAKMKGEMDETYALLDTVNAMIIRHTYTPSRDIFRDKITKFDYSLGPDVARLANGADALLFVAGLDVVSSTGRKAVQTGMVMLGLLGGVIFSPNSGVTLGTLALVDARDGAILAFKFNRCCGHLYEEKSAAKWVGELLDGFPLAP